MALAKAEIEKLGGKTTERSGNQSENHIANLQQTLQGYVDLSGSTASKVFIKTWCVDIGRLQRLSFVSPLFAQYWMSGQIHWWEVNEVDFRGGRPGVACFYDDASLIPLSFEFGNSFAAYGGVRITSHQLAWLITLRWHATLRPALLNCFCQVAAENLRVLDNRLTPAVREPASCRRMCAVM